MKYFIASDIHGSSRYCADMLCAAKAEAPDCMLLLGDLLYHGPRNDLPDEYDPKKVISMLNSYSAPILCVRGNCDSEVDQMVLDFPITADCCMIESAGHMIFVSHGHIFNPDTPPRISKGGILLNGHTHIPACEPKNGFTYINPGSVSIPKNNSPHSYIVLNDGVFVWKELGGKEYMKFEI